MKVAVINTVCLNTGDAAIVEALLGTVQQALGQVEFTIFDNQPQVAARLYPDWRFQQALATVLEPKLPIRFPGSGRIARRLPPLRLRAATELTARGLPAPLLRETERIALQTYASSDLVVSHGGTYLVEHYDLHARVLDFEMILGLGKPLILFTQSLGPFRSRLYRDRLRRIFESAALVLLRDEKSLGHLREIGVKSNRLHVVPDSVFALANDQRLASAMDAQPREKLRVAISVRNWPWIGKGMEAYEDGVARLAAHIVRQGGEVTFVSTCQGVPDYWTDDSRTAESIAARVPAELRAKVTVDRTFHDRRALGELFAGCDLVVATRMHAAILALDEGVPVLPIAYEFKTEEVFRTLGMGEYVTKIDEVHGDILVDRFDALVAALPSKRRALFEGVSHAAGRARSAVGLIREAVR